MGPNKFWDQKNIFGLQKNLVQENLVQENLVQRIKVRKIKLQKNWVEQNIGQKQFDPKNIKAPKDGHMSPGQLLPEQMSLLQLETVLDGPRNLSLKFGPNLVIS